MREIRILIWLFRRFLYKFGCSLNHPAATAVLTDDIYTALCRMGRHEDALACFERVAELDPADPSHRPRQHGCRTAWAGTQRPWPATGRPSGQTRGTEGAHAGRAIPDRAATKRPVWPGRGTWSPIRPPPAGWRTGWCRMWTGVLTGDSGHYLCWRRVPSDFLPVAPTAPSYPAR